MDSATVGKTGATDATRGEETAETKSDGGTANNGIVGNDDCGCDMVAILPESSPSNDAPFDSNSLIGSKHTEDSGFDATTDDGPLGQLCCSDGTIEWCPQTLDSWTCNGQPCASTCSLGDSCFYATMARGNAVSCP